MENNYTAIPNDYLEEIAKVNLNGIQSSILRIIERNTMGWHRKNHRISYRYISNAMGYNKKQDLKRLRAEFNKLVEMKIITIYEKGSNKGVSSLIGINLNYQEWIYEGRGGKPPESKVVKLHKKQRERGNTMTIQELLSRYNESESIVVNRFITVIKSTRKSGKIADSVLIKILTQLAKYPTEYVSYGLNVFNQNEDYHSKKERYAIGIVRGSFDSKELEKKKRKIVARSESESEKLRRLIEQDEAGAIS